MADTKMVRGRHIFLIQCAIGFASTIIFYSPPTWSSEAATVSGLALHQPFTVPECKKSKSKNIPKYPDKGVCWTFEWPILKDEESREFRTLWWSTDDRPPIGFKWTAIVRSGVLYFLTVDTLGVKDEEQTFNELQAKFGKPLAFDLLDMQNAFGMKFKKIKAVWHNDAFFVDFDGVTERIDRGRIFIETGEDRTKDLERIEKYEKAHPPAKL